MFTKVCVDPWTGHFVLTATSDKKIKVFDTQSGESFSFLTGHSEPITGLAFSNDCRHIVSSSADGCLFVWEMSRDLVKVIFQRRVDQNGVESIELDSILAVEHFLNKAAQQGFNQPLFFFFHSLKQEQEGNNSRLTNRRTSLLGQVEARSNYSLLRCGGCR